MEKSKNKNDAAKNESVIDILVDAYENSYQALIESNKKIKQLESELKIKGD
ncbi:hypothetical protein LCGC14_2427750 [marine sediment metagenome]|uniref:Uncharacterized protein n=1 Tax=marine sediment metagenome TaxID=412755 RepID=A0A0F9BMZ5_9ZZZZ